jgi:RNA polymerase sigma-70 factor (ECF subfamily)
MPITRVARHSPSDDEQSAAGQDDQTLLAGIRRGDRHALTELHARYTGLIERIVRAFADSSVDPIEVLDDVMIRIWDTRETVAIDDVPAYLMSAAVRRCQALGRQAASETRRREKLAELGPRPAAATPDEELDARLLGDALERFIADMPPVRRRVFVQRMLGRGVKDIAKEEGSSDRTVHAHMYKANKELADLLRAGLRDGW